MELDAPDKEQFQSTLPRGERHWTSGDLTGDYGFQSTLPRGERPTKSRWVCKGNPHFNPRSREGSDQFPQREYTQDQMDFNPRSREGSDALTVKTATVAV